MKKSLLYFVFVSLFVFMSGFTFGQCTPDASVIDPDGSGKMVPDTLEVWAGETAAITITVIAPLTGDVGGGTITIHHITVKSLINQPIWVTYVCNPNTNDFAAGVPCCVLVSSAGVVPAGLDDTIYMNVIVDVWADLGILGIVKVAPDYNSGDSIVLIVHPEGYGIAENGNNGFSVTAPQPNPFSSTVKLGCNTEIFQTVSLKIFDMVGKEIYTENLNTNSGENYFNFDGSNLNDGVYFYSVTDEQNRTITKKFIKSR